MGDYATYMYGSCHLVHTARFVIASRLQRDTIHTKKLTIGLTVSSQFGIKIGKDIEKHNVKSIAAFFSSSPNA